MEQAFSGRQKQNICRETEAKICRETEATVFRGTEENKQRKYRLKIKKHFGANGAKKVQGKHVLKTTANIFREATE